MQTIYYSTPNFIRHTGNVVDLGEYRRKLEQVRQPAAGLPPLPRRERRCPWGVRLTDLVSMSMVAMTIACTGMLVAVM